ncbi:putative POM121-like protein 1 [Mustela putorius furo]|uniref:POM121-like protein 1 n=1 Tax=Mustela putorius furo TaxID=9669 RepID=A0A8U0SJS4_MUSPF|nr:putative POM121-like protein 1 [Mustela putorius furo]
MKNLARQLPQSVVRIRFQVAAAAREKSPESTRNAHLDFHPVAGLIKMGHAPPPIPGLCGVRTCQEGWSAPTGLTVAADNSWRPGLARRSTPRGPLTGGPPSTPWGCQLKSVLSDAASQMSCRCRSESIVDTVTPCLLQKRVITGLRPSAPRNDHGDSTAEQNQPEKAADTTTGQKAAQRTYSSPADCSRPRKRKFPLLPHRRGEPLRLPSPPEPGFRVTVEDLDRGKKAALQRIQDALRGDTEATCSCGPASPSSALALPAAVAAPLPASDSQVTSRDCSSSSQPHPLGSHPGCSGSNVASTQAPSMLSGDITASFTVPPGLPALPGGRGNPGSTGHAPLGAVGGQWPGASTLQISPARGQPAAQAPDPLQALSTAVVQLSLGRSHIPRHKTKQRSRSEGGTSCKSACGVGGVLASPPSTTASVVSTAHTSLATKNPSSRAQHLRGRKRAVPCKKPSSPPSQPTS